jgi:hypothetical protein
VAGAADAALLALAVPGRRRVPRLARGEPPAGGHALRTSSLRSLGGFANVFAIESSAQGPTAIAIANALYDAIGVRVRALPLTGEQILAAMPD